MTSVFGGRVASEWDTVFPLIARDFALGLQAENRRRAERGDPPLPLEDTLSEALERKASDVIRKTHWPAIDLIGAQLNLYWAEFQIPVWRMSLRAWKLWEALANALERDGVLDAYDIVILDTPPALGYLTINGLTAADILLVPLGASFLEFDSTGRFFDMLHSTFQSIEAGENTAARALGRPEIRFEWDAVRAVITRFDGAQQAELAGLMQAYLGRTLSPWRQDFTALVGQAGEQVNGIYEADYRDFNRETYIRGRQTFDQTYAGFKRLLLASWRRDELPRRHRPREGDRLMARRRLAPLPDELRRRSRRRTARECSARGTSGPRLPRPPPPARSPASPPRPPARPRSRRWPRPCAAPARRAAWCSTWPSTPSPPTTWRATGCRREDEEMAALRASLRPHGQRTPIEVTPLVTGAGALPYGLISGWRRLAALKALHAETGEARFATVQALVRRPETAADAYVAMVEENEIRIGLSHYERARVAARATERGIFPSEKAALLALFATASRPKRSRIRAFLDIYHALDGTLRFPAALPERLGLRLVEKLRAGRGRRSPPPSPAPTRRTPEAEAAALAALLARRGRAPAPAAEILPGVALETALRGRALTLRLRGPGVTPELRDRLAAAAGGASARPLSGRRVD